MGEGNHYDDAVVFQVNEKTTLVQTVDFFTPVVDDPFWYGRIAAANALSDVYAMGGRPLTAMNICCFPTRSLGTDILAEILRGGSESLRLAGAVPAGGHTVEDPEPKFGLAVTGLIDPQKIAYKGGLQTGQELWLSKPLGSGILATAHKRDYVQGPVLEEAIQWMAQLNDVPGELMLEFGCRAATDITGYGLLGHALEMARASGRSLQFSARQIPLMKGCLEFYARGAYPGGSAANRRWLENSGQIRWDSKVEENLRDIFCDAQTSGGLLMGIPAGQSSAFQQAMAQRGRQAWQIGQVLEGDAQILVGP